MDASIYNKPDKELLEWELSLNSTDLRCHAWYHGNVPRNLSETLLIEDGEFLVRDSSTFARSGDYVLSCKWKGVVLHFLIHKEVLQPNTIYEQLGYRFENESFTTVQDLITFYVGNREPISVKSGAVISQPRTRTVPISKKNRIFPLVDLADNEYVALAQEAARPVLPVDAILIEKSFTSESLYQVSLNLKPPEGLLESLKEIPQKIQIKAEEYNAVFSIKPTNSSNFDLSTYSSILLPTNMENVILNPSLIRLINSRILECSDRTVAFHITKVDWEGLGREFLEDSEEENCSEEDTSLSARFYQYRNKGVYENFLNDSQFRWNHIIERCLTFSHFVSITVLEAEVREDMLNKWIGIANELKTAMGNFFSFCNVMRGLTCPKITCSDNQINWLKLRREYTNSAFLFETSLRNSYHNILQGIESYPPNTTIPNLLSAAIILEEKLELIPLFKNSSQEDKLKLTLIHMRQLYSFCDNEEIHVRNWQRLSKEMAILPDIILTDIFRTQTHLIILWGIKYNARELLKRCEHFENSVKIL